MDYDNARPAKRPRLKQISTCDRLIQSMVDNGAQAQELVGNIKDLPLCHEDLCAPYAAASQDDERSFYLQKNYPKTETRVFSKTPSSQESENQMNFVELVCFRSVSGLLAISL